MSVTFGEAPRPDAALDDHALALSLATEAGKVLLQLREELTARGADQRTIKDAGDRAAQQRLAELLDATRPMDEVLSEEARDTGDRLNADRVWIIDPLDGTREYSEGRDDWAVHVALWQGGDLVAGTVARPAFGRSYATPDPGERRLGSEGAPRMAVSRSRASDAVLKVADLIGADLVPMGSAGVKATSILEGGGVDIYLHSGGQYEWDSAAPVAVARAAGLHTSRLDGSPLQYNQRDPYLPDLLICPQWAVGRVQWALEELGGLP